MTAPDPPQESAHLLEMMVDLVDDIGQFLEWAELTGADALPAEGRLPQEVREAIRNAPVAPRPQARSPRVEPRASEARTDARETAAQATERRAEGASGAPSLGNWEAFLRTGTSSQDAGSSSVSDRVVFEGRAHAVYGYGSPGVPVMIIGEAAEDGSGAIQEPFEGSAGQMLARMLANVLSLQPADVYVANVVLRAGSGRDHSTAEERARCRSALRQRIQAVEPKVVLVLGDTACRTALSDRAEVERLRGRWHSVRVPNGTVRAMVSFHPSHLLRHASEKRRAFGDLKAVRSALAAAP